MNEFVTTVRECYDSGRLDAIGLNNLIANFLEDADLKPIGRTFEAAVDLAVALVYFLLMTGDWKPVRLVGGNGNNWEDLPFTLGNIEATVRTLASESPEDWINNYEFMLALLPNRESPF